MKTPYRPADDGPGIRRLRSSEDFERVRQETMRLQEQALGAGRRTPDQAAFDDAKHGWAFASGRGLAARVEACEKIVQRLDANDPRHETLAQMRQQLGGHT